MGHLSSGLSFNICPEGLYWEKTRSTWSTRVFSCFLLSPSKYDNSHHKLHFRFLSWNFPRTKKQILKKIKLFFLKVKCYNRNIFLWLLSFHQILNITKSYFWKEIPLSLSGFHAFIRGVYWCLVDPVPQVTFQNNLLCFALQIISVVLSKVCSNILLLSISMIP